MITIKLLGGAKKSFNTDALSADFDTITIAGLLDHLISIKPKGTPDLDTKNILVAVNGVDSSALEGHDTVLGANDTVSIIPIIHGGSQIRMKADGQTVTALRITYERGLGYDLVDAVRKKFPAMTIEGISAKCILSPTHIKKIASLSLFAKRHGMLLSKKLQTDILLRFACTRQISEAIKTVGIGSDESFFLISIGSASQQKRLHEFVKPHLAKSVGFADPKYVQKKFKISKIHQGSVMSKTPLEDLLVEKAAVLFK